MSRSFEDVAASIEFSLRLCGVLRRHGIRLGSLQTIACTRAIALTQAVEQRHLRCIYRVTLVNRRDDLALLERLVAGLFEAYFVSQQAPARTRQRADDTLAPARSQRESLSAGAADHGELAARAGYSVHAVDHHKDFRAITEHEFPAVIAAFESIVREHAAVVRRRTRRARRGRVIDLRASMRACVKFGGDSVEWRYRNKVPTHTRLVVLVDVSGSMEIYSSLLLHFLHLLHRRHRFRIEVFVFSTELQSLSEQFRAASFPDLLDGMSRQFSGWAGGTRIGHAIACLNGRYRSAVTSKSVVVVMSDGWDTGESELLDREMAKLSRRARSTIWLNPLKGDPGYQPLAIGMATARPYCDEFISGHSIESLQAFAALLDV